MHDKKDSKKDIINRLKRIEGQVKGIEKMIENGSKCKDILIQMAAIRAAINKAGALMLENYAQKCLIEVEDSTGEEKISELVNTLTMFIK